jgi:predicted glycosyltransferase
MPVPGDRPEGPELLIILSGPEPQRSIFQSILTSQVNGFPGRSLIVAGEPQKAYTYMIAGSCRVVSSLKTMEMLSVIHSARYIICRSGYSGIMDMVSLGKKALLIPTPGQTEQEYLSRHLESAGLFPFMKQYEFDIIKALNILDSFPFKSIDTADELLDVALSDLSASF